MKATDVVPENDEEKKKEKKKGSETGVEAGFAWVLPSLLKDDTENRRKKKTQKSRLVTCR